MSSSSPPSRHVPAGRGPLHPAGSRPWAVWLRRLLFSKLGCQLCAFGLFHAAEIGLKDHWVFAQLRQLGFVEAGNMRSRPEGRLSDEPSAAKVIFVDISGVPKVDLDGARGEAYGLSIGYTPREILTKLLARIAECQPAAIGFDIDFSSNPARSVHSGLAPAGHRDFLEACLLISGLRPSVAEDAYFLSLSSTGTLPPSPIPVFLGVGRSMLQPRPEEWLGGRDYAPLAAAISIFSDIRLAPPVYSLIPRTITVGAEKSPGDPLLSLSYSLAKVVRPELEVMPKKNSKQGGSEKAESNAAKPAEEKTGAAYDFFFARYSEITRSISGSKDKAAIDAYYYNAHVISDLAVRNSPALLPADFLAHPCQPPSEIVQRKIRGNIVLVGSADLEGVSDMHIVPGEKMLVPGVYLHAAGVLTLLHSPLAKVRWYWEIVLSIGLVFLADALVHGLLHGRGLSFERLQIVELVVTLLLVFAVSWAIAAFFNALWIAWLAAAVGVCWETAYKLFVIPRRDQASASHHP